jgi:DNA polymerase-3 subunit gamma/tau
MFKPDTPSPPTPLPRVGEGRDMCSTPLPKLVPAQAGMGEGRDKMPHQALARKWRPRNFQQMVGQEHVLQALVNALTENRLHHAYLFTGTRGVGKTTIARIFAKSLNCETGVTATPCGQCDVCRQIDAGTFIDLIEIDAASRTKVEDTRELLEKVPYAPHRGRYKVYVIDEVHALSAHSFNALLKTLEEPPQHAKFLLATTDPQKIPVTVLSRCLQFHLKHLTPTQIAGHLAHVLHEEQGSYDQGALKKIAKAAQGSMRDALSLLDQAIAFCHRALTVEKIDQLLGSIQSIHFYALLDAICVKDAQKVFTAIDSIAQHTSAFEFLLEELLMALHQMAVLQLVPGVSTDFADPEKLKEWSKQLSPEEVQLMYQIALIGRRDLPLAPSPQVGFEMVLLRMLFFTNKPLQTEVKTEVKAEVSAAVKTEVKAAVQAEVKKEVKTEVKTAVKQEENINVLEKLTLTGITKTLASYCVIKSITPTHIQLLLDASQALLLNEKQRQRLEEALNAFYGVSRKVEISVGTGQVLAPAVLQQVQQAKVHQDAVDTLMQDPKVQAILQTFDTQLAAENVKVVEGEGY